MFSISEGQRLAATPAHVTAYEQARRPARSGIARGAGFPCAARCHGAAAAAALPVLPVHSHTCMHGATLSPPLPTPPHPQARMDKIARAMPEAPTLFGIK